MSDISKKQKAIFHLEVVQLKRIYKVDNYRKLKVGYRKIALTFMRNWSIFCVPLL